jgi:foldase protein PrsA
VKNYIIKISFIALYISILICGCEQGKSDEIIAKVGDYGINRLSFIDRYEDYLIQTGVKDNFPSRKNIVESMVTEILLSKYDDNQKITTDPDYVKESKWIKDQVILAYLKDQEVYSKIKVTDKETRDAFLRANQKLNVSHLYAATEEEINQLEQLLNIGIGFETLAKQTFTDSTLRNNGGNLGFITWGDMEPEFEEVAYSLKVGEISKPVKTKHGYSIIKLNKKVTHPLLTENEYLNKKNKFQQIIRLRKRKPAEIKYINSVINFNKFNFNEKSIDKIWQRFQLKINGEKDLITFSDISAECLKYKDKVYSVDEIIRKLNNIPEYHLSKITSKEKLKAVMKGIVLKDELKKIAEDKGYTKNKYVKKKLEKMKTNLFMKFKITEIIENANISDSLVLDYYKSHLDFFSTHNQINVQEILVSNKDLANNIIKKIKAGKSFSFLAKKYSERKITAQNGGIIGLAPISKYGKLKNLFWNSPKNKLLGPLEINGYYGIFKVLEKKKSKVIEFNKVKNIAGMAVKFKLKNEILNDYVKELKTKVNVEIFDKVIGSTKIFAIKSI